MNHVRKEQRGQDTTLLPPLDQQRVLKARKSVSAVNGKGQHFMISVQSNLKIVGPFFTVRLKVVISLRQFPMAVPAFQHRERA
ncbi:hypothetical protein DOM21_15980 [Bacteriovorax stolpii]|nr:hypothetical protein DOM21_15980 [Bacteriovorax stolpii]